jgi:RES domain-containing protein
LRKAWRLTTPRHAGHAFNGEGARLYGGRFNHAGTSLVYCSEHLSLALLEVLVQADGAVAPKEWAALSVTLPDDLAVEEIHADEMPPRWRSYPAPEALKTLGTEWAERGESVALTVPSAVVPTERNLLLNPRHPDMGRLQIGDPEPFHLDSRLLP